MDFVIKVVAVDLAIVTANFEQPDEYELHSRQFVSVQQATFRPGLQNPLTLGQ